MKEILLLISILSTTLTQVFAQSYAFVDNSNITIENYSDKINLNIALGNLAKKYEAYFNYDINAVSNILVERTTFLKNNIIEELTILLSDTNLGFKKIGKNNFVIFESSGKDIVKTSKKTDKNPSEAFLSLAPLSNLSLQDESTYKIKNTSRIPKVNAFTVNGSVFDEQGLPMIGVNIFVESNPDVGTITDLEGKFELSVSSEDDVLVCSYLGYQTKKINIDGRHEITIAMSPDLMTLDEVIVVGFGTQKKRHTTGAISSITQEDLENSTQTTVEGALQGKVAGVMITTSDAMAGSPVSVRIRGTSSIVASSEPLYVVDGVPIVTGNYSKNNASNWRLATAHDSNALSQLNPADIESIEVLKDASAAAIYGSRGANGVILITTKRGKKGKTKFDFGIQKGFSKETNRIEMLDGPTYLNLAKESWTNSYNDALADDDPTNDSRYSIDNDYEKFWNTILPPGLSRETAELTSTDWIDQALRNGNFQELNFSASGGDEKTLFYLGGTYRDEEGIFVGNNFKRYNTRVNIDHNPSEYLSFGARLAYTITDSDIIPISWAGGLGTAQSQALPFWPIYNEDGTYFNARSENNVVAELENTEMNQKGTSILGNVYAQFNFLDNFSFRSEFGINNIYKKEFYYRSNIILPEAIATSVLSESINWNSNNTLSYSNVFNKRHSLDLLVGMNATKNDFFSNIIEGEGFPNPALKNPENAAVQTAQIATTQFSFLSFLGRLNYRLDDKYLLGFSLRRDGSSRFGRSNRWGTFPALSLGWIVSEESFLQDSDFLNFLKIRASYGETGNAEIGNFEYFGSFATSNYVNLPGIIVGEIDNNGLGWESTKQYDIGLDLGFWNGQIELGVDFYLKQTNDLLTEIDISALSGVERITNNIGKLENKGIDFSLVSHNINKKFKWTTNLNVGYNTNKITDLGGRAFIPAQGFGLGAVGVGFPVGAKFTIISAGIAPEDMMMTVTNPETGSPMEIEVKGGDELLINQFGEITNIVDPNDQQFIGNSTPVWTGGLTNSFSWNNFDLNILFTFAAGHVIFNNEQNFQYRGLGYGWNMQADAVNRWQEPGDETNMQRLVWTPERFQSSRFIYDADYIRLRDITFGYNIPEALLNKWNIGSMRIYLKGTNLATFTGYNGWDPEYNRDGAGNVGQGQSWLPSPQAKSVSFGLNLNF